jgi:hypothetical protein
MKLCYGGFHVHGGLWAWWRHFARDLPRSLFLWRWRQVFLVGRNGADAIKALEKARQQCAAHGSAAIRHALAPLRIPCAPCRAAALHLPSTPPANANGVRYLPALS